PGRPATPAGTPPGSARSTPGTTAAAAQGSGRSSYRYLTISENVYWNVFATMTPAQLAGTLKELARKVDLAKLTKHPRGPKKPKPRRQHSRRVTHVSTARILAKRGTRPK